MRNSKFIAILALASLSACVMKTKILDVTAVSMTKSNLNDGEKLQETGPVTGKFCSDTFGDKGSLGLIDESVKNAQTQSGVDFILNASVWAEGGCVSVEGTGAKIASAAPMSSPQPATKPTAPKKKHK